MVAKVSRSAHPKSCKSFKQMHKCWVQCQQSAPLNAMQHRLPGSEERRFSSLAGAYIERGVSRRVQAPGTPSPSARLANQRLSGAGHENTGEGTAMAASCIRVPQAAHLLQGVGNVADPNRHRHSARVRHTRQHLCKRIRAMRAEY